eukprot:5973-Heterococcus_DN1.PRE.6
MAHMQTLREHAKPTRSAKALMINIAALRGRHDHQQLVLMTARDQVVIIIKAQCCNLMIDGEESGFAVLYSLYAISIGR